MSRILPFDWSSLLAEQPLLPVWAKVDPLAAPKLAESLLGAGYKVLEVTLRQEQSCAALEALQASGLILVAGSLRHPDQLARLQTLGIRWAVSPGWCPVLAEAAQQSGIALLPGISTPGEAMQASRMGYQQVKLFPAKALGGPAYLQAIAAPLPEMTFVATGGVSEQNMAEWFALPQIAAVGGSWMLPEALIQQQAWETLASLAQASLEAAKALGRQSLQQGLEQGEER
ncbi:bifunctional 4-hydroxy-2-oxoglutarate aldolase/2-dehydro-3-deoxy-phosphogluconate aldolase [Marinospirillum insulare]|uniref:Aldolase n=1 Tax=Marinospirillum insulare TaxID=217169 RepID=A0ABQ6A258_9GAMM|nr:bifunctional 4-hydroxy-2-oxoglutarate aldolase/2-dehydro-3-deoxy-phosphogluconate aldolase [Marinospirillum insulare]GLR64323.1 aldolase [Marinospirillum insulare]